MSAAIMPMLAHEYRKHSEAVKYPCIVQKKFNGWRATITRYGIFTRSGQELKNCDHIKAQLKGLFIYNTSLVLDGELIFGNGNVGDLERLQMLLMVKNPQPEILNQIRLAVNFVCFDGFGFSGITDNTPYFERYVALKNLFRDDLRRVGYNYYWIAPHFTARNESDIKKIYSKCLEQNNEGVMIRNVDSPYCYGRSKDLLKLKPRKVKILFWEFEVR